MGGSNTRVTFSRLDRPFIVVVPHTKSIQMAAQQCVFSYGRDLSLAELTPYIFQFRHRFWSQLHWQINTHRKAVYLIRDGIFGKSGGSLDALSFGVRVVGGDKPLEPGEPVSPTYKPVKPVKPIRPTRPIRPVEPVGPVAFPGLPTKAPGQVRIHFPELAMTFAPNGKSLRIVAGNKVVCYGDGWTVSTNNPQSYTMR